MPGSTSLGLIHAKYRAPRWRRVASVTAWNRPDSIRYATASSGRGAGTWNWTIDTCARVSAL